MQRVAIIECDKDLLFEVAAMVQTAFVGQPIIYGDTLHDLFMRHCPQVYDHVKEAGFHLIPTSTKEDLYQSPPGIWFDIIEITQPN